MQKNYTRRVEGITKRIHNLQEIKRKKFMKNNI